MKPVNFPESNFTYTAPGGMENCEDLHVLRWDGGAMSLWQGTWRERLRFLFKGKIQLHVWGKGHPPVALVADDIRTETN